MEYQCELCKRTVKNITKHHLVPKEEGGTFGITALVCQPCHVTIHLHFSNKELAEYYNTVQKLSESDKLRSFLKWIKKQNIEYINNDRRKHH